MRFDFYSFTDLMKYFEGKNSIDVCGEKFFVSSVGDLLYVQEQYKKNNLRLTGAQMQERYCHIVDRLSTFGRLVFPEMNDFTLRSNLFVEHDDGRIGFDDQIVDSTISPRFSISRAIFKLGEHCFWDEDVVQDMEDWNKNFEC